MASLAKYKPSSVGRLFLHNNRTENDGIQHANDGIDNDRTHENYHMKEGKIEDLQNRLAEVFSVDRKDAVVLCEAIVTLPTNVPAEDEKKFFRSVFDFYCNDFGEKNIINAVVHKDEDTPHMHLDFVPVITGDYSYDIISPYYTKLEKWKETHEGELERICAYELLNRDYYNSMHQRLSDYIEQDLGYETEILNSATDSGNYSVLKLKVRTMRKQVEELNEAKDYLAGEIAEMYQLAEKHGIDRESLRYLPLVEEIDIRSQREAVYKDIMKRNGFSYKKEDLEKLKALKKNDRKGSHVFEGSYTDGFVDVGKNVVNVIELDSINDITNSPQKKFAEQSDCCTDLRMLFTRLKRERSFEKEKVTLKEGRKGTYCFVKPAPEEELSFVLKELEDKLRRFVKEKREQGEKVTVYMDRLESDRHDYGQMMIFSLDAEIRYHSRKTEEQNEEEERERTLEKQQ